MSRESNRPAALRAARPPAALRVACRHRTVRRRPAAVGRWAWLRARGRCRDSSRGSWRTWPAGFAAGARAASPAGPDNPPQRGGAGRAGGAGSAATWAVDADARAERAGRLERDVARVDPLDDADVPGALMARSFLVPHGGEEHERGLGDELAYGVNEAGVHARHARDAGPEAGAGALGLRAVVDGGV